MLNKIIKDEFGVDMSAIIPIPGWIGLYVRYIKSNGINRLLIQHTYQSEIQMY